MKLARRPLGNSELTLPILGFGASRLVDTTLADADATIHAAVERGMDHVDTAPFYGFGESERRAGHGLAQAPAGFSLSTKVGRLVRPAADGSLATVFDYSFDGALRSFDESLARLKRDRVDMLILHDVSRRWHGERTDRVFDEAMQGAYKALTRWRDEGTVRAIGIGINDCAIALRALAEANFDFIMLAGRTTPLDQEGFDAVLPECSRRGVGVIAAAPFNSGILAAGAVPGATYFSQAAPPEIVERTGRIEVVCARHGVPLRAAALQLPLRHPAVSCVLAGYRSAGEVTGNIADAAHEIPADLWSELAAEGLLNSRAA